MLVELTRDAAHLNHLCGVIGSDAEHITNHGILTA